MFKRVSLFSLLECFFKREHNDGSHLENNIEEESSQCHMYTAPPLPSIVRIILYLIISMFEKEIANNRNNFQADKNDAQHLALPFENPFSQLTNGFLGKTCVANNENNKSRPGIIIQYFLISF